MRKYSVGRESIFSNYFAKKKFEETEKVRRMLVPKRNKPWKSINYKLNLDNYKKYCPTKYFFIFFFFYFLFGGQISLGGCCYLILYINIYTYIIHIYKYIYGAKSFCKKKKKKKIFWAIFKMHIRDTPWKSRLWTKRSKPIIWLKNFFSFLFFHFFIAFTVPLRVTR